MAGRACFDCTSLCVITQFRQASRAGAWGVRKCGLKTVMQVALQHKPGAVRAASCDVQHTQQHRGYIAAGLAKATLPFHCAQAHSCEPVPTQSGQFSVRPHGCFAVSTSLCYMAAKQGFTGGLNRPWPDLRAIGCRMPSIVSTRRPGAEARPASARVHADAKCARWPAHREQTRSWLRQHQRTPACKRCSSPSGRSACATGRAACAMPVLQHAPLCAQALQHASTCRPL